MNISDATKTVVQIVGLVNSTVNGSDMLHMHPSLVVDLYEEYRTRAQNRILLYQIIGCIVGTAIVLSNLSVVISSGLILKKGLRPKSTYMLLGNVSLADTIMGLTLVFRITADQTAADNAWCVLKIGMLVCHATASIFSVGLIAVDRYIYILHGLYYRRWFNTARVRVGIVLIWMISIILGFLPATGWVNQELNMTRCYYVGLFPVPLVLFISLLSIVPVIVTIVLYTFILVRALKTVNNISTSATVGDIQPKETPVLRIHRGSVISKDNIQTPKAKACYELKRSASFDLGTGSKSKHAFVFRSKSIENIIDEPEGTVHNESRRESSISGQSRVDFESEVSVCTVDTSTSHQSLSCDGPTASSNTASTAVSKGNKPATRKVKEPNKWRAIKVVLLTSGSITIFWMPFYITAILFVFCDDKLTNPRCINLRALLGGPLALFAFVNSILNPIIYAWWHKGFQKSVKAFYRQYCRKLFCKSDASNLNN